MKQCYLLPLLLLFPLLAHADGLKAIGEAWALLAMLALGVAVLLLGLFIASLYRPRWRWLLVLQVPVMVVCILMHGLAGETSQSPPEFTILMQLSILLTDLMLVRQFRSAFVRALGMVAVVGSGAGFLYLVVGLCR